MNNLENSETIYSLSSGAGLAGVAVIRVSGSQASECLDIICQKPVKPRHASLRKICVPKTNQLLDECLVLWLPGPGTFTGEDVVELQIHGGRATVKAVLDVLSGLANFRQAEAGEFTQRAFLNGRLDFVEIEGLGDLIHAQTEAQRVQALNQSSGEASEIFNKWRSDLIAILGYLEASIDFIEEDDVENNALKGFSEKLIRLRNDMNKHLKDSVRGVVVRDGVRVVIAGKPNVGKSSILNFLAKREVAIVSNIPGTTRDVLEVQLDLNGIPVIISDTAGLRENTHDEIEREGMVRTRAEGGRADLVMWVSDNSEQVSGKLLQTEAEQIFVINKSDLLKLSAEDNNDNELFVSAKTGAGMNELLEILSSKISEKFGGKEPALISRQRQKSAIKACVESIDKALEYEGNSLEIVAEQLRLAANQLGRLVGRIDVEDLLDVIFRDFCVGK